MTALRNNEKPRATDAIRHLPAACRWYWLYGGDGQFADVPPRGAERPDRAHVGHAERLGTPPESGRPLMPHSPIRAACPVRPKQLYDVRIPNNLPDSRLSLRPLSGLRRQILTGSVAGMALTLPVTAKA
jgi:hypothetical protein